MIVAEYEFGNTKVNIHDDSFKSDEEIKRIIKRVEWMSVNIIKSLNNSVLEEASKC